jgi:HEPN domain-containing protein
VGEVADPFGLKKVVFLVLRGQNAHPAGGAAYSFFASGDHSTNYTIDGSKMSEFSADAETWLQWAEQSYAGAHLLFHNGNPILWFPAAFLGQQALEMFLKAALINQGRQVGKEDGWGHNLMDLATELAKTGFNFPAGFVEDLQTFNDFFEQLRFPHPARKVPELGPMEGVLLTYLVKILRPVIK